MRLFAFILLFSITKLSYAGLGHQPPQAPETGFGSDDSYIADSWQVLEQGSASKGDLTWLYQPNELKYGDHAPVVVFLHGFSVLTPDIYQTHIEHLLRQGNFVIFPQFQKSTFWGFLTESGIFSPMDQSIWARRAVVSVDLALEKIDSQVAWDEVYIYGHSLGGLISLAWLAEGGVPVSKIVLSHAQVDANAGMPDFVKSLVKVIEIPWREYAPAIDVPVVILNGEEDDIAPIHQSDEIFDHLILAPQIQYFIAQSDTYGYPRISPNHGAPIGNIIGLPAHFKIFGVSGEIDVLDWRFYFTALDAAMNTNQFIQFDMGSWSDGTPVIQVVSEFSE